MDNLLELVIGHVQRFELRVFDKRKYKGPPQGVHVADGQRGEEDLVEGDGGGGKAVRNASVDIF